MIKYYNFAKNRLDTKSGLGNSIFKMKLYMNNSKCLKKDTS